VPLPGPADCADLVQGPTGPADKQLNRNNVCPDNGNDCILRGILVPRNAELDAQVFADDVVQR
jgi:hypothetical protein